MKKSSPNDKEVSRINIQRERKDKGSKQEKRSDSEVK